VPIFERQRQSRHRQPLRLDRRRHVGHRHDAHQRPRVDAAGHGNKFLQRRLEISGTLDADNNYWLYVQNGGSLHLTSTAILRSTTNDGHVYFDAGASGVTLFSADAGATVDVADGLTLRLFSDSNLGNQFSARLNVAGAGALALTSGRFTLEGDSVIGGTGTFNLSNTIWSAAAT
jgi:hypothetical protein